MSAMSVNRQSLKNIIDSTIRSVMNVSVGYMMPGPTALRTELMSFVACAIRSPVGVFWK